MKPTVLSNIHWDKKKPQCDCLGFLETKAIGPSLPIHLFNIVSLVNQIWLKSHRLLLKRSTQKSTQLRTSDNGYHLTHSRQPLQDLRQRGEWTGCHPSQLMSQLLYLQNCVMFLQIYIRMTVIVSNWLVLFEISDRLCTDPSSVLATLLFCCVVSFVCTDAMRVTVALF